MATYASSTVVHESCAIRVDPAMPLDRAALIGCSVMTGVGAVLNTAAVPPGASMAVFGVGGVGLNVVQGGALVAAHPIIAVDTVAAKLDYATAMGATHGIDASAEDPVAAIRRVTGRGADYAFVAVGATRPITQALEALAPGGVCVLIGVPETGATIPLDVRPLVTAEREIRGSSYGSARTREDLPTLVGSISPAGCASTSSSTGATGSTRPTRPSARSPAASWRAASSSSDAAPFDARRLHPRDRLRAGVSRARAGPSPAPRHLRRARSAAPSQALRAVLGADGVATTVETLEGETAVLDSRVERFPDGSFVEDGTITYGSAGAITFDTVGRGHVGPSPRRAGCTAR